MTASFKRTDGDVTEVELTEDGKVPVSLEGSNVENIGTSNDAAVTSDTNGSLTGFMRGLVKMVSDVWDSTLHVFKVTQATVLHKTVDSIEVRPEPATPINLTASGIIRTGTGILTGMYVNSTSSGTVKLYDNTAASGTVINNTITPAVGWHNLGNADLNTGAYATLGGTIDVTFYYIPTP